ncbi:MAG: fibronectin type III domain-containing protein [Oscillospiraceae bacterium]|nr:fibronectin type III domain-containing protein [Oscillospiraceae bacterium]
MHYRYKLTNKAIAMLLSVFMVFSLASQSVELSLVNADIVASQYAPEALYDEVNEYDEYGSCEEDLPHICDGSCDESDDSNDDDNLYENYEVCCDYAPDCDCEEEYYDNNDEDYCSDSDDPPYAESCCDEHCGCEDYCECPYRDDNDEIIFCECYGCADYCECENLGDCSDECDCFEGIMALSGLVRIFIDIAHGSSGSATFNLSWVGGFGSIIPGFLTYVDVPLGSTVTITANPGDYMITEWTGSVPDDSNPNVSVLYDVEGPGPITITAKVGPVEWLITYEGPVRAYDGPDYVPSGTRLSPREINFEVIGNIGDDRRLVRWVVNGNELPGLEESNSFVINLLEENTHVLVELLDSFLVTIGADPTGYGAGHTFNAVPTNPVGNPFTASAPDIAYELLRQNSNITFTATPAAGYFITGWSATGGQLLGAGDGPGAQSREIQGLNSAVDVRVRFEQGRMITFGAHDGGGNVTATIDGTYQDPSPVLLPPGSDTVTFTATPLPGFLLADNPWVVNGDPVTSDDFTIAGNEYGQTLTIENLSESVTVTAEFEAAVDVTFGATGGSITSAYQNNNAFVSGATLRSGAEIVIEAAPNPGYLFTEWTVTPGETLIDADTTTLTIPSLSGNNPTVNITANFIRGRVVEFGFYVTSGGTIGGTIEAAHNGVAIENGDILAPLPPAPVEPPQTTIFTAEAAHGFLVAGWNIPESENVSILTNDLETESTLTITNLPGDIDVVVTFSRAVAINFGVDGTGGTLSAVREGSSDPLPATVTLPQGTVVYFTAEPITPITPALGAPNFRVNQWSVADGVGQQGGETFRFTVPAPDVDAPTVYIRVSFTPITLEFSPPDIDVIAHDVFTAIAGGTASGDSTMYIRSITEGTTDPAVLPDGLTVAVNAAGTGIDVTSVYPLSQEDNDRGPFIVTVERERTLAQFEIDINMPSLTLEPNPVVIGNITGRSMIQHVTVGGPPTDVAGRITLIDDNQTFVTLVPEVRAEVTANFGVDEAGVGVITVTGTRPQAGSPTIYHTGDNALRVQVNRGGVSRELRVDVHLTPPPQISSIIPYPETSITVTSEGVPNTNPSDDREYIEVTFQVNGSNLDQLLLDSAEHLNESHFVPDLPSWIRLADQNGITFAPVNGNEENQATVTLRLVIDANEEDPPTQLSGNVTILPDSAVATVDGFVPGNLLVTQFGLFGLNPNPAMIRNDSLTVAVEVMGTTTDYIELSDGTMPPSFDAVTNNGVVTISRSNSAFITVSIVGESILINATRPLRGEAEIVGSFPIIVTRGDGDGNEITLILDVHLTPLFVDFSDSVVDLNNESSGVFASYVIRTVDIVGTAVGLPQLSNLGDLPPEVTIDLIPPGDVLNPTENYRLIITGTRPSAGSDIIDGSFYIGVTRQGVSAEPELRINVTLTPYSQITSIAPTLAAESAFARITQEGIAENTPMRAVFDVHGTFLTAAELNAATFSVVENFPAWIASVSIVSSSVTLINMGHATVAVDITIDELPDDPDSPLIRSGDVYINVIGISADFTPPNARLPLHIIQAAPIAFTPGLVDITDYVLSQTVTVGGTAENNITVTNDIPLDAEWRSYIDISYTQEDLQNPPRITVTGTRPTWESDILDIDVSFNVTVVRGGETLSFPVTVTLTMIPQTWTVSFELDSGTHLGGQPLEQTVDHRGQANVPTELSRSGYDFSGNWSSSEPGMIPGNITGNVTFTALWTPREHLLTVVSENTTDATESSNRQWTSTFDIYAGTSNDDRIFSHWTASYGGNDFTHLIGDQFDPETTFTMPDSPVTLTAHWSEFRVITFNPYPSLAGSITASFYRLDVSTDFYSGDSVPEGATATLKAESNDGYSFYNWTIVPSDIALTPPSRTSSEVSFYVYHPDVHGDRDIAITANFNRVMHMLEINNPAMEGDPTQGGNRQWTSTVQLIAGTRENYRFTGWVVNAGGVEIMNPTNHLTASLIMPNNPVVITAQWRTLGSAVTAPELEVGTPLTSFGFTVSATLERATGQAIEFAIGSNNTQPDNGVWRTGTFNETTNAWYFSFAGLDPYTEYFVFARSAEIEGTHDAGVIAVSGAITTLKALITNTVITGIVPPVTGASPVTTAPGGGGEPPPSGDGVQWTATIEWRAPGSDDPFIGIFTAGEVYTARITIEPSPAWTLEGFVGSFTIDGAPQGTIVSGPAIETDGTGVVTVTFPETLDLSIELYPTGIHTFSELIFGYNEADLTPLTVTVTNTGNTETGPLTISLSGANPEMFTLSSTTLSSIPAVPPSSTSTFTITPNIGLSRGTYTATITVRASDFGTHPINEQSFGISFTVAPRPITGANVSVTGGNRTFTGDYIEPPGNEVIVELAGFGSLFYDTDFEIAGYAYNFNSDYVDLRPAEVMVNGIGNFTGTATGFFIIDRALLGGYLLIESTAPLGYPIDPAIHTLTAITTNVVGTFASLAWIIPNQPPIPGVFGEQFSLMGFASGTEIGARVEGTSNFTGFLYSENIMRVGEIELGGSIEIIGIKEVGEELILDTSQLTPDSPPAPTEPTFDLFWYRNGEQFRKTTHSDLTHIIEREDLGTTISARIVGTDPFFGVLVADDVFIPPIRPDPPLPLTATPGDGQVTLNWGVPAFDGGSPITGYEIRWRWSDDGGTTWMAPGPWTDVGNVLTSTVTGLVNNVPHEFEVRAVNIAGPGSVAGISATPRPLPVIESITPTAATLADFTDVSAEGELLPAHFTIRGRNLRVNEAQVIAAFAAPRFGGLVPGDDILVTVNPLEVDGEDQAILTVHIRVLPNTEPIPDSGFIEITNIITPAVTGRLDVTQLAADTPPPPEITDPPYEPTPTPPPDTSDPIAPPPPRPGLETGEDGDDGDDDDDIGNAGHEIIIGTDPGEAGNGHGDDPGEGEVLAPGSADEGDGADGDVAHVQRSEFLTWLTSNLWWLSLILGALIIFVTWWFTVGKKRKKTDDIELPPEVIDLTET